MIEVLTQALQHPGEILIVAMTMLFLLWMLTPPAPPPEPEDYEPVLYRRVE